MGGSERSEHHLTPEQARQLARALAVTAAYRGLVEAQRRTKGEQMFVQSQYGVEVVNPELQEPPTSGA